MYTCTIFCLQMVCIFTGLKLRLEGSNDILKSFSYSPFPAIKLASPVEWQYLVIEHHEAEVIGSIHLHQLARGDKMACLLEQFKLNRAEAVIFINTEDSYELIEDFLNVVEIPCPLIIVKKTDGEEILKLCNHHKKSISARVDTAGAGVDTTTEEKFIQAAGNKGT